MLIFPQLNLRGNYYIYTVSQRITLYYAFVLACQSVHGVYHSGVHESQVSKIPVIECIVFWKRDFLFCCDRLLLVSGAVSARGLQGQQ